MPRHDPRRAHAAVSRTAELLGRRTLPASYPAGDPAELYQARRTSGRPRAQQDADAVLLQMRDGGRDLLRQAVELERSARAAQEAAIGALRLLGFASLSWTDLGAELGVSGQAAHKRYRHLEEPVDHTIDDELAATVGR